MYKKLLKSINLTNKLKKQAFADLYKSEGNPIKDRKPHFIFSAEQPFYPENMRYNMSHSDVMDLLRRKGYKAEEMQGMYGKPEKSIIVHNPSKTAVRHLLDLSKDLGQESSIHSDGYNHNFHYHGGPNAGKHAKGQGTTIHKKPPEDFFSTMADGTCFTHLINFDELHDASKSVIKQDSPLNKSENRGFVLTKNENNHPLETAGPDTKLIHYSPTPNLSVIDPFHHGVRRIGAEAKQGKPEHPQSFYYLEDTVPEGVVTGGTQAKYVTRLGHHKLYDVGKDPEGIRQHLKTSSANRQVNAGIYTRDELDAEIKRRGYHGIYNSSLDDTMKNVVAMYHPMAVEKEMKIHPKDYEKATSTDHQGHEESLKDAKQYAKDNGHHDGSFLHKLALKFGGE
jgi:hypothetical protein